MKSTRQRTAKQSDEIGIVGRTDRELKRERLDKLIAEIRVNRPWWASRPPWEVEAHLEAGAKSQAVLPFDGGLSDE